MGYEYVLFDLDGTLTDPGVGITNSVMYALQKYGIDVLDRAELYKFIGPPLLDSFMKYYGFSEAQAKQAIEYYREDYKKSGIFENILYGGCEALLAALQSKGIKMAVATSKPEVFAEQILEHFGIAGYFAFIGGSNLDGTRVKKDEVISYVLQSCGVSDPSKAIMVGDRMHDIIGAKKNGLKSIGVLFGYGDKTELEEAGADFIVDGFADIERIIFAKNE